MVGETDLVKLLGSMHPVLNEAEYVFAYLDTPSTELLTNLTPLGTFLEPEGLTVIVLKSKADALGVNYHGIFKNITLNIHSSLEAVGLTAAVSSVLANQGISANVVAAFYHDHIFVPSSKANQALTCLLSLASDSHK